MSRRRYKRRGGKGGGFFKTAGTVLKTAQSALRTAKFVKSLLNVEYKVHDVTDGPYTFTGPNDERVIYLSGIGQGNDAGDRNGDSIRAKGLTLNVNMWSNAAACDRIRILLIKDKHNSGVAPQATDVLKTANWTSFRNLANTDRFKVLWDQTVQLRKNTDTKTGGRLSIKKHFKLNHHIKYSGTTANVADGDDNALYAIIIGEVAAGFSSVGAYARLRYIDN